MEDGQLIRKWGFWGEYRKVYRQTKGIGVFSKQLAREICTQATISKFENGGKMIATKILTQLYQRLSLSLSDIFPGPVD